MFIYSPYKYIWSTDIQNALLFVCWPPHDIAIDYSSIGLKKVTIQQVFNKAWQCVLVRFLHHKMSQVCTATLENAFQIISVIDMNFFLWRSERIVRGYSSDQLLALKGYAINLWLWFYSEQFVLSFVDSCGIVEGSESSTPHSWPWQVSFVVDKRIDCTGSLIGRNYFITTAFCAIW